MVRMVNNLGEFKMVEVSDYEYWKEMNYYDGILYLSLLVIDGKDDWRMVRSFNDILELNLDNALEIWNAIYGDGTWTERYLTNRIKLVIPVRDVND